jgi:hypothetical protein
MAPPMQDAHSALPFEAEDLQPLSVEEVSLQLRVSYAFTQLCLDCGCPLRAKGISAAELLHWLFENYESVRVAAGLTPLAAVDDVHAGVRRPLRMASALFTLLEFGISRASDPRQKRELRQVARDLERKLECR